MHRSTRHTARSRAVTGLAISALTAGMIAGATGDALATGPTWRFEAAQNATLPGGLIKSVSCSAADACTAVGAYLDTSGINVTLAERWNGRTWRVQPTPNPDEDTVPAVSPDLLGVSCPTSDFCEAVGSYVLGTTVVSMALEWNGRSWKMQPIPVPTGTQTGGLDQVSCPTRMFCEAVGSYDGGFGNTVTLAATWNGTSWRVQPTPNPPPTGGTPPSGNLDAVSCVSAKFCEAGGTSQSTGATFAERWNGRSWRLQSVPGTGGVKSVSCASASFCEAVGNSLVDVWHGLSWRAQPIPGQGGLTAVSCPSAASCEAVGAVFSNGSVVSDAARWNGTKWSTQPTPNPVGATFTGLGSVSCPSASTCQAVGDSSETGTSNGGAALAETWNGHSWQLGHAVTPASATVNMLAGVSCVSARFCEAVGSHFDRTGNDDEANLAEMWNGTSWTIQATPDPQNQFGPTSNSFNAVSCVTTRFCEAIGTGPNGASAEVWNGTSWKVQTRPGGAVTPQSVSCATVNFCMSVDGFARVAIWNGSSWSAGPSVPGFSPAASVSCPSATDCEVVGSGPSGQNAAVWNGSTWTAQATAGPAGVVLDGVSCTAVKSCEAVGGVFGQGHTTTLAEVWNGTTWTIQPSPNPAISQGSELLSVSCASAGSCTAVGQYQYSFLGLFNTLAEVWNGKTWTLRSTPNNLNAGQNILNSVSCGAVGACTAVGQTDDLGETEAALIEAGD